MNCFSKSSLAFLEFPRQIDVSIGRLPGDHRSFTMATVLRELKYKNIKMLADWPSSMDYKQCVQAL